MDTNPGDAPYDAYPSPLNSRKRSEGTLVGVAIFLCFIFIDFQPFPLARFPSPSTATVGLVSSAFASQDLRRDSFLFYEVVFPPFSGFGLIASVGAILGSHFVLKLLVQMHSCLLVKMSDGIVVLVVEVHGHGCFICIIACIVILACRAARYYLVDSSAKICIVQGGAELSLERCDAEIFRERCHLENE